MERHVKRNLRILSVLSMLQDFPTNSRVFKMLQDAQVRMLEGDLSVVGERCKKTLPPLAPVALLGKNSGVFAGFQEGRVAHLLHLLEDGESGRLPNGTGGSRKSGA